MYLAPSPPFFCTGDAPKDLPPPPSMFLPSEQLPPTAIGKLPALSRHWHVLVLFTVVESLSITALVTALLSASEPKLIAVPGWDETTTSAINTFSDYFGNDTRPTWEAMAQAAQPPKPWAKLLDTGLDFPRRTAVQIFGPNVSM